MKCSTCGEIIDTQVIEATGHDYTYITLKEATCTTNGKRGYTCQNCGDCYSETILATGHIESDWEVETAATCTTDGLKVIKCEVCGEILDSETILATGHNYVSEVTKEATCEEDGVLTYTCTDCGDSYTEVIEATGHDYELTKTVEAKCIRAGYYQYTCANCGDTYKETIAKTGVHDYVLTSSVEPTCTIDGTNTYKCSFCQQTMTETVKTTGHTACTGHEDGVDGYYVTNPTLTSTGEWIPYCSTCGEEMPDYLEIVDCLYDGEEYEYEVEIDADTGETTTVYGHHVDEYTNILYEMLNDYREENGLEAYEINSELEDVANIRSTEIAYDFSHTRPNGTSISTLLSTTSSGQSRFIQGENIACGDAVANSAKELMTTYMNGLKSSTGHNAAMLSNAKYVGIAVFAKYNEPNEDGSMSYSLYIVMDFGTSDYFS